MRVLRCDLLHDAAPSTHALGGADAVVLRLLFDYDVLLQADRLVVDPYVPVASRIDVSRAHLVFLPVASYG